MQTISILKLLYIKLHWKDYKNFAFQNFEMGGNTSQEIEDHLENLINPENSEVATHTTKFEWEFMNNLIGKKLSDSVDLDSDLETSFECIDTEIIHAELLRAINAPETWNTEFENLNVKEINLTEDQIFRIYLQDLTKSIINLELGTITNLHDALQMCKSFDELYVKINESHRSYELIKKGYELQKFLCAKTLRECIL